MYLYHRDIGNRLTALLQLLRYLVSASRFQIASLGDSVRLVESGSRVAKGTACSYVSGRLFLVLRRLSGGPVATSCARLHSNGSIND
jgi:hypothetical protein